MSLFGNGPQLADNSRCLLVSAVNRSDVTDVTDFNPVLGGTFQDMSLCLNVENTINHGESPQVLPILNHRNVMIQRVTQRNRGPRPAASTADNDSHHWSRKRTAENPLRNADVVTGAVDSQAPEVRPVKWLNFQPTTIVKAADDAEYSDKVDTDDEIQATLHDIEASNKKALSNAEKLAAERQQTVDLTLSKVKSHYHRLNLSSLV